MIILEHCKLSFLERVFSSQRVLYQRMVPLDSCCVCVEGEGEGEGREDTALRDVRIAFQKC